MNQQLKGFKIPGNFEIDGERSIFGNQPPPNKIENISETNQTMETHIQNAKRDEDSGEYQMSYSDHSFDLRAHQWRVPDELFRPQL